MTTHTLNEATQKQLRSFVERLENLAEEQKDLAESMKDTFAEAKAVGFDVKQIRRILKLRKMNPDQRRTDDAICATYLHALGMAQPTLFDWLAASEGQPAGTERERDDTTVTISAPGHDPITMTGDQLKKAAAKAGRAAASKKTTAKVRGQRVEMKDGEPVSYADKWAAEA